MKIYQLVATGNRKYIQGRNKIYSKHVFSDRSRAVSYKPVFKNLCETPIDKYDLSCLEKAEINIVELELV